MIYNTVSSKAIIGRLINSHNIHSADYISRVPQWIGEALGKLNISMGLEPAKTRVEINEYKAKLPSTIKVLHAVEYNGYIIPRINGKRKDYITSEGMSEYYQEIKLVQDITYDINGNITSVRTSDSRIPASRSNEYNYILNKNGFLDFSISTGEAIIYFLKLPEEIDSDTGMYFPLVPDVEMVITAIEWYCLMMMLYRGYKHQVLALSSPNRYLNPAAQWEHYMPIAQNKASAPDPEERKLQSKLWTSVVLDADHFIHSFVDKIAD